MTELPMFDTERIREKNVAEIGGIVLLTAEGRRRIFWEFGVRAAPNAICSKLVARERRWVTWKLFGLIPVLVTSEQEIDLPLTRGLGALYGAERFGDLESAFTHPLCRFGKTSARRRASDGLESDLDLLQVLK